MNQPSLFDCQGGSPKVNAQQSGINWTLYCGDCCEVLRGLPDDSIHYGIHSPPFSSLYIYSDSENAIAWVYTGVCKTNLKHTGRNALIFAMIRSAENWLAEYELDDEAVLKWDTKAWGENPADYGRK